MFKLKVKQVRLVTYALGLVASLLLGILGFRFLGEYLTSRASDAQPQNLAISAITQNSAKVVWTTDQENQVVIEYGTSPTSLTFFAPEAIKTKTHSIELNLLTKETTYYFQIKAGDRIYDNGGVPWTFTTLAESEQTAQTEEPAEAEPSLPPEMEATPTLGEDSQEPSPSPTLTDAETSAKDTDCDLNEYKSRFYTEAAEYDQDDNGVVNLRDWSLCNSTNKLTPTP